MNVNIYILEEKNIYVVTSTFEIVWLVVFFLLSD